MEQYVGQLLQLTMIIPLFPVTFIIWILISCFTTIRKYKDVLKERFLENYVTVSADRGITTLILTRFLGVMLFTCHNNFGDSMM